MNLTLSRPSPSRAEESAAGQGLGSPRIRRIARVLIELLLEAGRGTLMLAPVIVPPGDDHDQPTRASFSSSRESPGQRPPSLKRRVMTEQYAAEVDALCAEGRAS